MKYVENFDKKLEKFAEVIIKIGANVQKGSLFLLTIRIIPKFNKNY